MCRSYETTEGHRAMVAVPENSGSRGRPWMRANPGITGVLLAGCEPCSEHLNLSEPLFSHPIQGQQI